MSICGRVYISLMAERQHILLRTAVRGVIDHGKPRAVFLIVSLLSIRLGIMPMLMKS
jgi:hypothetical protein